MGAYLNLPSVTGEYRRAKQEQQDREDEKQRLQMALEQHRSAMLLNSLNRQLLENHVRDYPEEQAAKRRLAALNEESTILQNRQNELTLQFMPEDQRAQMAEIAARMKAYSADESRANANAARNEIEFQQSQKDREYRNAIERGIPTPAGTMFGTDFLNMREASARVKNAELQNQEAEARLGNFKKTPYSQEDISLASDLIRERDKLIKESTSDDAALVDVANATLAAGAKQYEWAETVVNATREARTGVPLVAPGEAAATGTAVDGAAESPGFWKTVAGWFEPQDAVKQADPKGEQQRQESIAIVDAVNATRGLPQDMVAGVDGSPVRIEEYSGPSVPSWVYNDLPSDVQRQLGGLSPQQRSAYAIRWMADNRKEWENYKNQITPQSKDPFFGDPYLHDKETKGARYVKNALDIAEDTIAQLGASPLGIAVEAGLTLSPVKGAGIGAGLDKAIMSGGGKAVSFAKNVPGKAASAIERTAKRMHLSDDILGRQAKTALADTKATRKTASLNRRFLDQEAQLYYDLANVPHPIPDIGSILQRAADTVKREMADDQIAFYNWMGRPLPPRGPMPLGKHSSVAEDESALVEWLLRGGAKTGIPDIPPPSQLTAPRGFGSAHSYNPRDIAPSTPSYFRPSGANAYNPSVSPLQSRLSNVPAPQWGGQPNSSANPFLSPLPSAAPVAQAATPNPLTYMTPSELHAMTQGLRSLIRKGSDDVGEKVVQSGAKARVKGKSKGTSNRKPRSKRKRDEQAD